jgi:hypothetical protein
MKTKKTAYSTIYTRILLKIQNQFVQSASQNNPKLDSRLFYDEALSVYQPKVKNFIKCLRINTVQFFTINKWVIRIYWYVFSGQKAHSWIFTEIYLQNIRAGHSLLFPLFTIRSSATSTPLFAIATPLLFRKLQYATRYSLSLLLFHQCCGLHKF